MHSSKILTYSNSFYSTILYNYENLSPHLITKLCSTKTVNRIEKKKLRDFNKYINYLFYRENILQDLERVYAQ